VIESDDDKNDDEVGIARQKKKRNVIENDDE
jgi:hypothetical protein